MIGKLLRGAGSRHGLRLFAFCACASLAVMIGAPAPAAAQRPPYHNKGFRWTGTAQTCVAPLEWIAQPLFPSSAPNLPAALRGFCLYTWSSMGRGVDPTPDQIAALFSTSQALHMTEDVPVVFPNSLPSTEEVSYLTRLRGALREQVGDASLLPKLPQAPAVRVVVIDSAPDSSSGHIQPGVSRHGDTLAHLIEDIVCQPDGGPCAAEVTTALALPWITRGVPGPNGGYIGSLADVSRAIERAVEKWVNDRKASPATTPARLLLNLSLGWEDSPGIADCSTAPFEQPTTPAEVVRQTLQYAASQGALIISAAGNDSGGPAPRTGLLCPGRYQAVPRGNDPLQSLLIAVSGLDYQDHPLETARPLGITGIAGLGLGGVAWGQSDPVPPALTGSSVATAVVSAVSALVWAAQPSWTPGQVTRAVYDGGLDVGAMADACPLSIGPCPSHRVSVCGALHAAGTSPSCAIPGPKPWSSPDLPDEVAAFDHTYQNLSPIPSTLLPIPMPMDKIPRYLASTVQVNPDVFPQPIATTCRTCVAIDESAALGAALSGPHLDVLLDGQAGQVLTSPVLVVRLPDGAVAAAAIEQQLAANQPYVISLPSDWVVESAYLTGFEASGTSVTEQIFVQQ